MSHPQVTLTIDPMNLTRLKGGEAFTTGTFSGYDRLEVYVVHRDTTTGAWLVQTFVDELDPMGDMGLQVTRL